MAAARRRSSRARSRVRLAVLPLVIVALAVAIWFLARDRGQNHGAGAVDFAERLIALAAVHGAIASYLTSKILSLTGYSHSTPRSVTIASSSNAIRTFAPPNSSAAV